MFDFFEILKIFIAVYLLIGILLGTVGPAGKVISVEIERQRGTSLTNSIFEREAPSEKKLLLLRILMTLAVVLLWAIVIWGILKELDRQKKSMEMKSGLWFSYMGGSGSIHCQDCQHTEDVTSFIHGIDASYSGFQCQSCGLIKTLTGGGRGKANQYKESLTCECGGKFDRDERLFCPQCKSENLTYDLEYIT